MAKSRVRKKNGKKVKYTPKPTGLSKTKMKKIMEMIEEQQKNMKDNNIEIKEESKPSLSSIPTDDQISQ